MAVESPVSQRLTVVGLLLLTFATGLVDAVSVLVLGHVFVANMTGNVIFLGLLVRAALRRRHDRGRRRVRLLRRGRGPRRAAGPAPRQRRPSLAGVALGIEVVMLADAVGPGGYRGARLPRQQEADPHRRAGHHVRHPERDGAPVRHPGAVSTTVLTHDDRRASDSTAGWRAAPVQREKLRYGVVLTMCAGAVGRRDPDAVSRSRRSSRSPRSWWRPARPSSRSARRRRRRRLVSALCHQSSSPAQPAVSARSIAEHLAARGLGRHRRGPQRNEDADAVTALNPQRISSVILDVTDDDDIAALDDVAARPARRRRQQRGHRRRRARWRPSAPTTGESNWTST